MAHLSHPVAREERHDRHGPVRGVGQCSQEDDLEGHEIKMTISPFMLPRGSGSGGGVVEDIYIKRAGNKVGHPYYLTPVVRSP